MKILLQRVARASVSVKEVIIASINKGLLVFFGAEKADDDEKIDFLAEKALNLRIFPDQNGKMNLSCLDVSGEILIVSQFTLTGDCKKGRRPGFDGAASNADAEILYKKFIEKISRSGLQVATGKFGAEMQVELINDGPVTFILDR